MQSDNGSQPPSRQPQVSSSPTSTSKPAVFSINEDDAAVLRELLDKFQEADADVRNTIVVAAMAELCALRPATEPFDKLAASAVCVHMIAFSCTLTNTLCRKLESGFSITTHNRRENMSNSPASGPLGVHTFICAAMRS